MEQQKFSVDEREVTGYCIPIGPVNLVFAQTKNGLVGCGAVDVIALEKFSIPAAKVRPADGDSIRTFEDLFSGIIVISNRFAEERGVQPGLTGRDALKLL